MAWSPNAVGSGRIAKQAYRPTATALPMLVRRGSADEGAADARFPAMQNSERPRRMLPRIVQGGHVRDLGGLFCLLADAAPARVRGPARRAVASPPWCCGYRLPAGASHCDS